MVQVVANPLISLLGPPATVHSRLTFAQAFNSLGTTIFPYVGSVLILGSLATIDPKTLSGEAFAATARRQHSHRATYLGLAAGTVGAGIMVWGYRNHLREHRDSRQQLARGAFAPAGAAIQLRGSVHLSVCGCGGSDRVADRQLSDADATCWALGRRRPASTCHSTGAARWSGASSVRTCCACSRRARCSPWQRRES